MSGSLQYPFPFSSALGRLKISRHDLALSSSKLIALPYKVAELVRETDVVTPSKAFDKYTLGAG